MHETDQILQSASPPKDPKPSHASPMFSFTDPRHSHAFVLRMRNARPDPSQFKIKLFKIEMDIPGVEEALNPENPLGHMERIGLSMAAMSFLSPSKCKIEENQNETLPKGKANPELHEKVQVIPSQGDHQQINQPQEKGLFSNTQQRKTQENSNQYKEIPQLSGHELTQSESNSSQAQQDNEEFYSPSEHRRKMQEKTNQNERSVACTKDTDDQRSSILTQPDQRTSFFSQTDQTASKQSQNFQRTSFLSENEQRQTISNQQNEDKKIKQSEQTTETLIDPENSRKSSLRLSFQDDQSSWTSPVAFSSKNPPQKILKEPFGSMLLPGEGSEDIFEEQGEEDEKISLPQEKSSLSKHRKNNYSIDTPSFRNMSHTTPIIQLSFSESMYATKTQDILANVERQDCFSQNKNCFTKKNYESYLDNRNAENLIQSYQKHDQQQIKRDNMGQEQEQKIDYLTKSDRTALITPENQPNSKYDNKYQIQGNYGGLPNVNGINKSALNEKQNSISSILGQSNTSFPIPQYQQQSQYSQTNNPNNSNNFQINSTDINGNATDNNNKITDINGSEAVSSDKPQFDKMDQIINDCLKHTSALFEQIKQDQIQRAKTDLIDAKENNERQYLSNYQTSNNVSDTYSYQDAKLLSQFPGNVSPQLNGQPTHFIPSENPKNYLKSSQSYQSNYLTDNLRQYQPSYESAQKNQAYVSSKNLGTFDSSNPLAYSVSEQKSNHYYQDKQHFNKSMNREPDFQSHHRVFSHLSASVDYSLNQKLSQSIPQSLINKPFQVQDIQGNGQSNSQINNQSQMNLERQPGMSFPWKKIHHSMSPQKYSISSNIRTNLEESASSQDKHISPTRLAFPLNNSTASASIDLQKFHKKSPSCNVPQQVQNETSRESTPTNRLFQNLIYEGSTDELNRKQGFGILKLKSSQEIIYQGYWKNNIFEGEGMIKNIYEQPLLGNFNYFDLSQVGSQWKCYEGQFSNGLRHGKGVLTLSNLEKFSGVFEKDIANGHGIFVRKDSSQIIGYWIENKFKPER